MGEVSEGLQVEEGLTYSYCMKSMLFVYNLRPNSSTQHTKLISKNKINWIIQERNNGLRLGWCLHAENCCHYGWELYSLIRFTASYVTKSYACLKKDKLLDLKMAPYGQQETRMVTKMKKIKTFGMNWRAFKAPNLRVSSGVRRSQM